ncbi:MAG: FeoB-associated Cys-rich membrane protein [Planctomycetes bacterium]|nr:FeoB-associated Cys-rich membrane protein [Planctomycetota bacterium]
METVIVIIIVGAVLFLSARGLYRTFTGKNNGCGGCSSSCPLADTCKKSFEMGSQSTEKPAALKENNG